MNRKVLTGKGEKGLKGKRVKLRKGLSWGKG